MCRLGVGLSGVSGIFTRILVERIRLRLMSTVALC
jgi:hypothetical protein